MSTEIKTALKDLLRQLTQINAGSGNEQPMIRALLELVKPHADEVTVDAYGNVIAKVVGASAGNSLMLVAHSDEIGLVVKNILPNGFILFEKNGDVPNNLLPGRKVYVGKNNVPGVIGTKPGHLQTPEEMMKVKIPEESYIDIGAASRGEVEALGIGVGDPIIWQSDFMELSNPDRVATKAVDDRVNCAILVQLLRSLKKDEIKGTVYCVFSVMEEVGLYGAMMAATTLSPDYTIVLDTIPAGDTPDVMTELLLPLYIGRGPGFPISNNVLGVFYSFVHPAVRRVIEEQAGAAGVNLQKCTLMGGRYATDAAKAAYVNGGIPTATLAVPRRYSHSPIELVDLNDAAGVYAVLSGVAKANADVDLSFI